MAIRQMAVMLGSSALLASIAVGTPVLLTAPVTITPTTTAISPTLGGPAVPLAQAEIIVSGTTLTVTGRHTIQSLTLLAGGRVTHPTTAETTYAPGDLVRGMHLIVTGDVTIAPGGLIDADGQGFGGSSGTGAGMFGGGNCGGGGGGHGGAGGRSNCANIVGGSAYGNADQPVTFGSGGGGYPGVTNGGIGGGVVRIDVAGSLALDGAISANGIAISNSSGGAGGSVWVRATSVTGGGAVRASGATEMTTNGSSGGGGGGRIAIETCSLAPTVTLVVAGGAANPGAIAGSPGSIVVRAATGCTPTCDDIDFNNNDVYPEDQDVIDFFNVLAGAECASCNDIDFNNNTVFPEDQDVIDFFNVLAGGECS